MFFQTYRQDFIKKMENKGNPENLNVYELDILADTYGKLEVNRNKKQLKAYLKGNTSFTYHGRKYDVMSELVKEE